ncbi:MAG TPA: DUF1631 family protein, partial [Xanthomonadaceae bacterium]|nr:DUF1631 family protein [Xanthomonadaceae bacterium]
MPVTGSPPSNTDPGHATLSTRAFPRRVRTLLEGIFEIVTGELDRGLIGTLDGLEQQLFKLAEQARSNEMQLRCLEALGTVKRGRFDLMPRYIASLETSLAVVRDVHKSSEKSADSISFNDMALVAETDMDETTLLHEISSKAEMKASLPLFLLAQRFGVIAGRPALDSESLPVGPATLCRHLRRASHCFELHPEHRQLLFRQFDRHVMNEYVHLVEAVNAYLVNQGVLPNLAYIPARFKHAPRSDDARPETPQARPQPSHGPKAKPSVNRLTSPAHVAAESGATPRLIAFTGWPGDSIGAAAAAPQRRADDEIYTNLRELLRSARPPAPVAAHGQAQASRATVTATDVQSVLGLLQRRPQVTVMVNGQLRPPSINHVKQDLLAQLRQITGNDVSPS